MTDGRIKVQHDGMSHLIDQLGAGLAGIRSSLDTLDAEVATLRDRWSGEASDAYDRAQRAWSAQLAEFADYLALNRDRAIDAQDVFADAKKRNAQIWS